MLVSWQFSGPYGVTKYGSGWRKDVVNQCLEFDPRHVPSPARCQGSTDTADWPQGVTPAESKSTWCLTYTETTRLIKDGEKGWGGGGETEITYLSLHCHHQNDSCIKMGSNDTHFNFSLIVRDKLSQESVHRPQLFKKKESRNGFDPRPLC